MNDELTELLNKLIADVTIDFLDWAMYTHNSKTTFHLTTNYKKIIIKRLRRKK